MTFEEHYCINLSLVFKSTTFWLQKQNKQQKLSHTKCLPTWLSFLFLFKIWNHISIVFWWNPPCPKMNLSYSESQHFSPCTLSSWLHRVTPQLFPCKCISSIWSLSSLLGFFLIFFFLALVIRSLQSASSFCPKPVFSFLLAPLTSERLHDLKSSHRLDFGKIAEELFPTRREGESAPWSARILCFDPRHSAICYSY